MGFVLSEAGWHELLDSVFAGSIRSTMSWQATAVLPAVAFTLTDTITLSDASAGFTLADAMVGEVFDIVASGLIAETAVYNGTGVMIPSVSITETLVLTENPTLYTLSDVPVDSVPENIGYVFTVTGCEAMGFTETLLVRDSVHAEETMTAAVFQSTEIICAEIPFPAGTLYPAENGYIYDAVVTETPAYSDDTVITVSPVIMEPLVLTENPTLYTLSEAVIEGTLDSGFVPNPTSDVKSMSDKAYGFVEPKSES
jgi:hypothetical protein